MPILEFPGLKPRRVLIVEDEFLVALLLEDLLAEAGIDVAAIAASLGEAQRCLDQDFDFAILDVNLGAGGMSYPIADQLLARGKPFFFLTGYGPDGVSKTYAGAMVVQKPISRDALMLAIARLFDGAG